MPPFSLDLEISMRQKKVKIATKAYLDSKGVITDFRRIKKSRSMLYLEIGSGKGDFISKMAIDHPDIDFVAIEVNPSVCYRILVKKLDKHIENLTIILGDANHLSVYFDQDEVDHIFLNFSDPWPKKRHHKRRLTALSFLKMYRSILKEDGTIQFRTDHEDFFRESLLEIEQVFDIVDINENLSESPYMTEYEVKKRPYGPIYQVIGKVKKHD